MTAPPIALMRKLRCVGLCCDNTHEGDGGGPSTNVTVEDLVDNYDNFARHVHWLESTKIRLLEVKEREVLKNPQSRDAWMQAFRNYLIELNIVEPSQCTSLDMSDFSIRLTLLDRLLTLAIQDLFSDLDESGQIRRPVVETKDSTSSTSLPTPHSTSSEADLLISLVPCVNNCLSIIGYPLLDAKTVGIDEVASAIRSIWARVDIPSLPANTHAADLNRFPVGFQCPDPIKPFAVVLRLLHSHCLCEVQDQVNDILTRLQNITADPKTDNRLGRVGR